MSDFNPLVTIVIPVYNGSNFMREAIDSAINQTYANIEIIVVNDGSTDETDEIAKEYGTKIRYFAKENGGVSTALNLAILNMRGEYFSWLSHDDVYLPDKVERQINILKELTNKKTVVFSGFQLIDERSRVLNTIDFFDQYSASQLSSPLFVFFEGLISGCTLLVRKDLIERFSGFDVSQRTTQDYDLWFKILQDTDIIYDRSICVSSRLHGKQTSRISPVVKEEYFRFWKKCFDSVTEHQMKRNYSNVEAFWIHNFIHYRKVSIDNRLVDYLEGKAFQCLTNEKITTVQTKDLQIMLELIIHNTLDKFTTRQLLKTIYNRVYRKIRKTIKI